MSLPIRKETCDDRDFTISSPMGCDLPMSLVLSCSSSLVLHIFRTRASVSIGLRISLRSFVGAFTLLKRRLVRLEYCSCSVILEPSLLILFVRLFIVWFCHHFPRP
jgi:hypothetical protein